MDKIFVLFLKKEEKYLYSAVVEKKKKKTQCKSTRDSMPYRMPLDDERHKKKQPWGHHYHQMMQQRDKTVAGASSQPLQPQWS